MANGATATKAIPYSIHLADKEDLPTASITPDQSRFVRAGIRVGILMAKPETPNGWGWNPATLGFGLVALVSVFGFVGTLMWASYYVGSRDTEQRLMNEKLTETKAAAEDAHSKSLYAISKVDGGDGHAAKPDAKKPKGKKTGTPEPVTEE